MGKVVSKSVRSLRVRRFFVVSLTLVSIILVSYVANAYFSESVENPVYAASDMEAGSVDRALVSANAMFAFNLFRELVSEDSGNVFISPLSVSMALAMAYNGAEGSTKDAMSNTLNFGGMSMEKVNQEFSTLIQSLGNVDQQVNLLIGNSIWIRQEFGPNVNASFVQRVQSSYDSEIYTRDFDSPQTVNEINNWIESKTNGKIKDAISPPLDPQLAMLLINAIYFKGEWVISFNKNETMQQDFYVSQGNTTQVDMMQTSGHFEYYSDENCEVARLPYGRDKVAMYIFLPNQTTSLDSFIDNMNQTVNDKYIGKLQTVSNLVVELPKFKVEYDATLNDALTKLGMGIAFGMANFNGIAPGLFISSVQHNAAVEVNEEGTEAAGATSIYMYFGTHPGPQPVFFIVNRPFFFEIRDDRSGSILFMGAISNPTD